MVDLTDKSGRPIEAGSYIVYGHNLGRCAGLRFGRVLKITERKLESWERRKPNMSIQVIGVDDDWDHYEPGLCSRQGTLQFPSRIMVLDAERLPEKVRMLLDGYCDAIEAGQKPKLPTWGDRVKKETP